MQIEGEYRVTLSILAVAVEQLLVATDADAVVISRAALMDAPDLETMRDGDSIVIKVSR
jgi:dolichyl-phosphate-mannose--protein O-mannosyl transferase